MKKKAKKAEAKKEERKKKKESKPKAQQQKPEEKQETKLVDHTDENLEFPADWEKRCEENTEGQPWFKTEKKKGPTY